MPCSFYVHLNEKQILSGRNALGARMSQVHIFLLFHFGCGLCFDQSLKD